TTSGSPANSVARNPSGSVIRPGASFAGTGASWALAARGARVASSATADTIARMFMIVLMHANGTTAGRRPRDGADWLNEAIVSAERIEGKHTMPNRRSWSALLLCSCLGCASAHGDGRAPRGFSFVHHAPDPPAHLQQ